MDITQKIQNFLAFQGNLNIKQTLCCIFAIEFLRVMTLQICACLSLAQTVLSDVLGGFVLMTLVLYLYGITITARLRNLRLNPSLAYFWVLGIWFVRYIVFPAVQSTQDIFRITSVGFLFVFMILPLAAKNKEVLLFWK